MSYDIESGQVSSGITLNNDYMDVSSGGVASNTIIDKRGEMCVFSGGVANDTTVNFGYMSIIFGGVASNTTIDRRGVMYVSSGGVAEDINIQSGGSVYVYSGGSATNVNWRPFDGGDIYIAPGAYVTYANNCTGVYLGSGNQLISQTASMSDKVCSGYDAKMYVMSGGVTSNTTIRNGAAIFVCSGGTALGTTVISSGSMSVASGGSASGINMNGGFLTLITGAVLTGKNYLTGSVEISKEANIRNAEIFIDFDNQCIAGWRYDEPLAFIENLESLRDASLTVVVDNCAADYFLLSRSDSFSGYVTVSDGTSTLGTLSYGASFIRDGLVYSLTGDSERDGVYFSVNYEGSEGFCPYDYWEFEDYADALNNRTVQRRQFFSLTLNSTEGYGADLKNLFVAGQVSLQPGFTVTDSKIYGTLTLYDTTATRTTVNSGGLINNYGDATDTTINSGGMIVVGCTEYVKYIGEGGVKSEANGIARNTTVNSGGVCRVDFGGSADTTTVNSGGILNVNSGGSADGVTLNGGKIVVHDATAANITAANGGLVHVHDEGRVENVEASTGAVIRLGEMTSAENITVDATASLFVGFGSEVEDVTINGGAVHVTAGGMISDVTISNDGKLYLYGGAILEGVININGCVILDDIALNNSHINFVLDESLSTPMVNDMALLAGESFSVAVDDAECGSYILGGNAAEFDSSVTITSGDAELGSLSLGESITVGETEYSLELQQDSIILRSVVKIELAAPDAAADITAATNKSVTVTATFDNRAVSNEYRINNGAWQVYQSGVVLAQNGTVSFRSVAPDGTLSEVTTVVVDNIDLIAPDKPVAYADITDVTGKDVTVTATFAADSVLNEYSVNGGAWQIYDGGIVFSENGEIAFRSTDEAGNVSQEQVYKVNNINNNLPEVPENSEYCFVKKSYSNKITGKKQDGIKLQWGGNAVNSLDDVPEGMIAVLLDSKNTLTAIPDGIETIAGKAEILTIKGSDYKANFSAAGTLNLNGIDTGEVEFLRFATVNVTDGAVVGNVDGGKETISETVKTSLKNGIATKTVTFSHSVTASGKVTVTNATAGNISGYSTVTLDNGVAGELVNSNVKISKSDKTVGGKDDTITHTTTYSASGTATLKNNSEADSITGFNTVKITTQSQTGDIERGDAYTEKYSLKDGEESVTKTFSRAGSLTASEAYCGNISGFATVKLTGTDAGDIELGIIAKITDDEETIKAAGTLTAKNSYAGMISGIAKVTLTDSKVMDIISSPDSKDKLSGSVTMTGSTAGNVENYSTLTLSGSIVSDVSNVNKVTAKSGFNAIASYTGSDGNDTLTINKNAVLALGTVDMGAGAKDKFVNNGTLVLTGDFDRSFISGKGEIVAASGVFDDWSEITGVLNLGATAEGFRSTKHENSDDTLKKAVKWDLKAGDYTGWLGSWQSGSDNVDFIKFTIGKNDVDKELCVSGVENFTLFDKKGNEVDIISAAGTYTLKLELDGTESTSYTLALA